MNVVHVVDPPVVDPVVCEDPDDDKIIAAAVHGRADMILTGDRHLLKIGSFQDIPILRVHEFLKTADQ